jgi:hypothetical protein
VHREKGEAVGAEPRGTGQSQGLFRVLWPVDSRGLVVEQHGVDDSDLYSESL